MEWGCSAIWRGRSTYDGDRSVDITLYARAPVGPDVAGPPVTRPYPLGLFLDGDTDELGVSAR